MKKTKAQLRSDLFELIHVMTALTSVRDLDTLLSTIAQSALDITDCDGVSLYLRFGDMLRFVISRNESLEEKLGKKEYESTAKEFTFPITTSSIAGFVASTGQPCRIDDLYHIENKPYSFDDSFSKKYDYKSVSMLTTPLLNREKEVIGVLQLMNKIEDGEIVSFESYDEDIAMSLGAQAAVAIENVRLNDAIREAHYKTIMLLSEANEFRDNETGFHVRRVSLYSARLAQEIGLSEEDVENIKYASPLHDVGKIGIPDQILKKPGQLTAEEYEIMKTHTTIAAELLGNADFDLMQVAADIARSHHEKWDGSGYPSGLSGEEIPLFGRIVAIADVFDALSNKRVYKPAFGLDETFSMIEKDAGTHFDPELVKVFLSIRSDVEQIYAENREED